VVQKGKEASKKKGEAGKDRGLGSALKALTKNKGQKRMKKKKKSKGRPLRKKKGGLIKYQGSKIGGAVGSRKWWA